ncbi:hypothetical protein FGO68_gene7573 [Halteria grandinella]|uniref:Palmitoyltransferase n=1 Tax=Halteria grandinella TaxID=5974 RepID=A0A8J8SYK6_HALGN|nr:hypothetical protein FGO68_gene7573 [Halteria grandinella]
MEELLLFVLFVLCTGSFFYMLVCTDSNSKTPMGWIRRIIYTKGPHLIKQQISQCRKIFGKKFYEKLHNLYQYIFYTNNPIGQILYILIFWSAFGVYYKYGIFKHFGNTPYVNHIHTACGAFIFIFCNYIFYRTCTVSPGVITSENCEDVKKRYEEYYDEVLYKSNQTCQTCKIIKPARSKHCRVCDKCISRFDHHCIWVRQCIGQNNYKYFVIFLFSHIFLCCYGVLVGILCLYGIAVKLQLFKLTYKNSVTGEIHKATAFRVFSYIIDKEPVFVFVIFVCLIFSITLIAFFLYHLNMIKNDKTTNERIRKNDFQRAYLTEMQALTEYLKTHQNDEAKKRLGQLKQCWKSLNNGKYQGLVLGLKKIFSYM